MRGKCLVDKNHVLLGWDFAFFSCSSGLAIKGEENGVPPNFLTVQYLSQVKYLPSIFFHSNLTPTVKSDLYILIMEFSFLYDVFFFQRWPSYNSRVPYCHPPYIFR